MTLDAIGTLEKVKQGMRLSWSMKDGEKQIWEYKGERSVVKTYYDELVLATPGNVPEFDTVEYDAGKGLATITMTKLITPGEANSVQPADNGTIYELEANELSIPIEQHPHWVSLSDEDIMAVKQAVEDNEQEDDAWSALQLSLYRRLMRGVTEYTESSYVLRETKTVSLRSLQTVSFTNINEVVTPPSTAAINPLITSLPSGQWIKKAPTLRQLNRRQWLIVTEWWWYRQVDAIIYTGGTWLPET